MTSWLANTIALLLGAGVLVFLSLGLIWRIGAWQIPRSFSMNFDEGLRLGAVAPPLAGYSRTSAVDLSFREERTFLVFGRNGCKPCESLLEAATAHPVARTMRRIYMTDNLESPPIDHGWEIYQYHNEAHAREWWRVPASPYFYVIDERGLILEKGLGSHEDHLDLKLLPLAPAELRAAVTRRVAAGS
jgi:hypothetical protein